MHPFRLKKRGSTLSHILVAVVPSEKDHSDIDIDEVLSSVVEKIKEEKELSVYQLLNHPGSEDILTRFIDLLGSSSQITRSQALLVIAAICSFDVGRRRLTLLLLRHTQDSSDSSESVFLDDVTSFLTNNNDESMVVNDAMATLCTLASSLEGRRWLLAKDNFHFTIFEICRLLTKSDDKELKSSASLLIARITAEEEGCARILNCRLPKKILLQIMAGLDIQEPSEQIGVALGQIMRTDVGRVHIMMSKRFNQMVLRLVELITNDECGWSSCFALCSLAANNQGLSKILTITTSDTNNFIENLFKIIWKGILTEVVRHATRLVGTLITAKDGWELIKSIDPYGKKTKMAIDMYAADQLLVDEMNLIVAFLKSLPKPEKPTVQVLTATSVHLEWKSLVLKCNLPVSYCLHLNGNPLQSGTSSSFSINDLSPYTNYTITLQQMTDRHKSQLSDNLLIKTKESAPSLPRFFKSVGTTTSQLKLSWLIPEHPNGVINGYVIYCQGKNSSVETSENYHIFSNLAPETMYTYEVCAFTSAGKGQTATLSTRTASLSDYSPTNITATIVGRSEILLQWDPPVQPLGRLNYYEARMNDRVIYSGIDRKCRLRQIKSGTEPMFTVAVWTSEGKCEAKPITKKLPRTNVSPSQNTVSLSKHKRAKKYKDHPKMNMNYSTAKTSSSHPFAPSRTTSKPSKINTVQTHNYRKSTPSVKTRSQNNDFNIAKLRISKQSRSTAISTTRSPDSNTIIRERPQTKIKHTAPLQVVPSRPIERQQVKPRLSIQNITLETLQK